MGIDLGAVGIEDIFETNYENDGKNYQTVKRIRCL